MFLSRFAQPQIQPHHNKLRYLRSATTQQEIHVKVENIMNPAISALRGPARQTATALSSGTLSLKSSCSMSSCCITAPLARQLLRSRPFHATTRPMVNVGDSIPSVEVMEGSPGNKVNLADELKSGNGVIVGVPAAFSPSCTASHVPGYINSPKLKQAGKVFVVTVNDAFVTKAWGDQLDAKGTSGVRFIADPSAAFTSALDLTFDGSAIFGGDRAKRFALLVEDGKVKEAFVEPDNTGVNGKWAKSWLMATCRGRS